MAKDGVQDANEKVTSIEIIGTRNAREEELVRALLGLTRGKNLNGDKVRQSLKRVMARGYYRNVEIFKRPAPTGEGVVLQVRLSPSAYLEEIRIQGLLKEEERLVLHRLDVRSGDPVSDKTLASVKTQVSNIMEELGYADALVQAYWDQKERVGRTLLLGVEKGKRRIISEIVFGGELPESARKLSNRLTLRVGAPLVQTALNQALAELLERMGQQGFLTAAVTYQVRNISPPQSSELAQEPSAENSNEQTQVYFHIAKGPRYALLFTGQQAFTAGYLKQNVISMSA